MAEPLRKAGGLWLAAWIAAARARVARIRLSRSAALRALVHRPPAIDSPARLITASAVPTTPRPGRIRCVGVPLHVADAAGVSGEHRDGVSIALEPGRERPAEQAAAAGNHDAHAPWSGWLDTHGCERDIN